MAIESVSGQRGDAQRLAELASALPDVEYIFRLAPDRAFEYVSDSVTGIVGYTPQEHYDDPNLGNRLVDPRDLHVLAAAAQIPPGEIMEYSLRWITRDGRRVWTHHRCRILRREDGAQVLYGVARDVTGVQGGGNPLSPAGRARHRRRRHRGHRWNPAVGVRVGHRPAGLVTRPVGGTAIPGVGSPCRPGACSACEAAVARGGFAVL